MPTTARRLSSLLPPDDSAYGFDNVADVLGSSPALLQAYLGAARKISTIAVGDARVGVNRDTYTARQDLPKSHWRYPLSREEWLGKYRANAARVLASQRVEQLQEYVEQLEAVADVRELGRLLGTD